MERRSFLLASGSALLSGTAISGLQRPAFGLEFELLTTPSTDPSNINSVLVDFDKFKLTPQYVDSSEDATITIEVTIGDYYRTVSKTVSTTNGTSVDSNDLKPEVPIVVDKIDTTKSSMDGEIVITVEHSSIGSQTYNQTFTITDNPLLNGLVAYYPMEKGAGRVLHDSSDNSNDGSIIGSRWDGSGNIGNDNLVFDGSDDYVRCNYINGLENIDSSVSFWVKPRQDGQRQGVIGNYNVNGSVVGYYVAYRDQDSDSEYELQVFVRSSSSTDWITIENVICDGSWRHITVTRTGSGASGLQVYNNGQKVSSENITFQSNDGGIARYKFDGDVTDSWGDNNRLDNTSTGFVDGVYGQAKEFKIW